MASFYSFIKYVNNSISDEYITLGLVVVTGKKSYFKVSQNKLDFAYRLNPSNKKLLEFSIEKLKRYSKLEDDSCQLFSITGDLSQEMLNRLSSYNNGILQFSKPTFIKLNFNLEIFGQYFEKFVGKESEKVKEEGISSFKLKVENQLYQPLREKIDVDYTLKKKSLPSLFFDFHFDGIGVNGAMYAAKAIDFNSKKKVSTIQSEIAEYESVLKRLNQFAEDRSIAGDHQYYLIADMRKDNVVSYNDLYGILKDPEMESFKLVGSSDIGKIVRQIERKKTTKFSEVLEATRYG